MKILNLISMVVGVRGQGGGVIILYPDLTFAKVPPECGQSGYKISHLIMASYCPALGGPW